MALNENGPDVDVNASVNTFHYRRTKLNTPDARAQVIQPDPINPAGRLYHSDVYSTPTPDKPKILSSAIVNVGGVQTMISVNVEPSNTPLPEDSPDAPYETRLQFFNKTNRNIRVTDKHNVTVTLQKPRHWNYHDKEVLLARKTIRLIGREIIRSVVYNHGQSAPFLSVDDGERRQIVERIEEEERIGGMRNPNMRIEIVIDRIVPLGLFNEYLSIYVSDLDILVAQDETYLGTPHPTSQDAQLNGQLLDRFGAYKVSGVVCDIVDNESLFQPRYICIGNKVLQVPITRDRERPPGIYMTEMSQQDITRMTIQMVCHPLEKAEELGIYRTKEEAMSKGRLNDSFKLELANAERELARVKNETDIANLERKEALNRLEHTRAADKISMERAHSHLSSNEAIAAILAKMDQRIEQDKLDREAAVRKNSSEMLKWLPGIFTACMGITAAVLAVNGKSVK